MKYTMTTILRALNAEILKSKRTLMLALIVLAPLALAFMELAIGFQYGKKMYRMGGDTWMTLVDHISMMWVLLLLPLFVTLEMGLLGALEHNNKTWKQLFCCRARGVFYMAKQIIERNYRVEYGCTWADDSRRGGDWQGCTAGIGV